MIVFDNTDRYISNGYGTRSYWTSFARNNGTNGRGIVWAQGPEGWGYYNMPGDGSWGPRIQKEGGTPGSPSDPMIGNPFDPRTAGIFWSYNDQNWLRDDTIRPVSFQAYASVGITQQAYPGLVGGGGGGSGGGGGGGGNFPMDRSGGGLSGASDLMEEILTKQPIITQMQTAVDDAETDMAAAATAAAAEKATATFAVGSLIFAAKHNLVANLNFNKIIIGQTDITIEAIFDGLLALGPASQTLSEACGEFLNGAAGSAADTATVGPDLSLLLDAWIGVARAVGGMLTGITNVTTNPLAFAILAGSERGGNLFSRRVILRDLLLLSPATTTLIEELEAQVTNLAGDATFAAAQPHAAEAYAALKTWFTALASADLIGAVGF